MVREYFEYKGINSLAMHLRIENSISFPSPEADISLIEVLGRDGELAVNNNRLKGVSFPIPVKLKLPSNIDVNTQATKISEWLKNDIGWHPLRFSGSPDYEYIAICYEQFDIKETLKNYGKTVINFRLKPYKRRIDSRVIEVTNGTAIVNPEKRTSKPLIYIEGNGDAIIKNNGKDWLIINKNGGIEDSITIDSDLMSAYKDNINQFDKMYGELTPLFPVLACGDNAITWTGNITKMIIEPRWEAIT